jgi:hypothetical protein
LPTVVIPNFPRTAPHWPIGARSEIPAFCEDPGELRNLYGGASVGTVPCEPESHRAVRCLDATGIAPLDEGRPGLPRSGTCGHHELATVYAAPSWNSFMNPSQFGTAPIPGEARRAVRARFAASRKRFVQKGIFWLWEI